jgi:transcriptional regulator with XRE-family HTH domain
MSKFLKEKRQQAGYSQGDIAKKLGYTSPQFISNWERGLSKPPVPTLRKLAHIYNINLNEMFELALKESIGELTADLTEKFYKQGKGK